MVGSDTLYYIHRRLDEIKGIQHLDSRFGNISILAVGDFFQLRPVKQGFVFSAPRDSYAVLHGSLWVEQFRCIELTQVMRQKDRDFPELLNRLREGTQTESDIDCLKSRVITDDDLVYREQELENALHLFARNIDVDRHNEKMLKKMCSSIFTIPSEDSTKDEGTRQLLVNLPDKPSETGGLRKNVEVGVGARVMLTYNINVQDGLVNGACGVVRGIILGGDNIVETILIQFDNPSVGNLLSSTSQYKRDYPDCVPIKRVGASFWLGKRQSAEVSRQQFPITMAWALTIHKVQGQTVSRIVIDMKHGRFQSGQAYVAFSRVTSLDGLFIVNFDKNKIHADASVKDEMKRLRAKMVPEISNSRFQNASGTHVPNLK